jgi:hypothetical protein
MPSFLKDGIVDCCTYMHSMRRILCFLAPRKGALHEAHEARRYGLVSGLNNPAHERGFLKFNDNCTNPLDASGKEGSSASRRK